MTVDEAIIRRNAALDLQERRAKQNPWRFLCWLLPHRWEFTHLFDEPADYNLPFGAHYGSSNYAGICLRCGKRDLFHGPLRVTATHDGKTI
jgi:hypothetical protein